MRRTRTNSSCICLDLASGIVAEAARNHRQSLKNPPKAAEEVFTNTLEELGLTQTVSVLREYMF